MSQSKLLSNCVLLTVVFHRPWPHRRFKHGEAEVIKPGSKGGVVVDHHWVSSSRKVYDSEGYTGTGRVTRDTWAYLKKVCLPFPLRRGCYAIPLSLLEDVTKYLDSQEKRFVKYANQAQVEYDKSKELAKEALGDLYDPNVYYSVERFRAGFWVERRLEQMVVPDPEIVGDKLHKVELKRWNEQLAEAELEVKYGLRAAFKKLIETLAKALTPAPGGEKRKLRKATYNNTLEFLDLFSKRDVLDDGELKKLVAKAKLVIDGDYESLKDSDTLRQNTGKILDKVVAKVDQLIEKMPKRKFQFDDGTKN